MVLICLKCLKCLKNLFEKLLMMIVGCDGISIAVVAVGGVHTAGSEEWDRNSSIKRHTTQVCSLQWLSSLQVCAKMK